MNILFGVELPKQYHITIVLKPIINSQRQYILVQSEEIDEEATAPAGWKLLVDCRDKYGYMAMFTRFASLLDNDIVTISLVYSDKLATAREMMSNDDI